MAAGAFWKKIQKGLQNFYDKARPYIEKTVNVVKDVSSAAYDIADKYNMPVVRTIAGGVKKAAEFADGFLKKGKENLQYMDTT